MINIVVGLGVNKSIFEASKTFSNFDDLNIEFAKNSEELIAAYKNNQVDGIIRGSLSSSTTIEKINNLNKKSINRATFIKHNSSNKLYSDEIYEFLLAPVGIDEGKSLKEKFELAIQAADFMNKNGKDGKIAILSGGRSSDYGRSENINKSLEESEKLTDMISVYFSINSECESCNSYKNKVKNYNILIEQAIKDKNNIIIAPDGIIGNIIFRTLVLLNSWNSYGAIALGSSKLFIDTSRDQNLEGYKNSIELAYNLIKKDKEILDSFKK